MKPRSLERNGAFSGDNNNVRGLLQWKTLEQLLKNLFFGGGIHLYCKKKIKKEEKRMRASKMKRGGGCVLQLAALVHRSNPDFEKKKKKCVAAVGFACCAYAY
ncbi:hypothetical protein HAX54_000587 [Datura stramonium]|uniref:Uncharacterized protein n=1 Tax=Datura stramonium TaxID=4076 RepID=A0ABS8T377_DATST|nr:hypothetical protein [Datura stramonium]